MISPDKKALMDVMLEEFDVECVKRGLAPLSVVVMHDDGSPSTAFLNSVKRFKLRRGGESEADCFKRLLNQCFDEADKYAEFIPSETLGSFNIKPH